MEIVERVIERQRWFVIRGWTSDTIVWIDPPATTDEHKNPKTKDEVTLPSDEWVWKGSWEIETQNADTEGWTYATTFNRSAGNWSSDPSMKIVRKREWRRVRVCRDLRAEVGAVHSVSRTTFSSVVGLATSAAAGGVGGNGNNNTDGTQSEIDEIAQILVQKYDRDGDNMLNLKELTDMLKEEKFMPATTDLLMTSTIPLIPMNLRQSSTEDVTICTVCYEQKVNCCILPCGHHVLCMSCATRVKEDGNSCIVCRKPIADLIHTYTT